MHHVDKHVIYTKFLFLTEMINYWRLCLWDGATRLQILQEACYKPALH